MDEATAMLMKEVLGPEHRDTLANRNNLGLRYQNIGQLQRGRRLVRQNRLVMKRVLGPSHPLCRAAGTDIEIQN
jgi:hypothetical protein